MDEFKPQVSTEAVQAKTGKTWEEWFEILDAAGAQKMNHQEIVAYLSVQHGVGEWWQQMVTVTYEQTRGLRARHENPQGFQISRSKTLPVSPDELFDAWQDPAQRAAWLADPDFRVRKETRPKSLRITWVDGQTNLEVMLYPKGPAKTQVSVQHNRLESAEQAEAMKSYWIDMLNRLEDYLIHDRTET